ncbi:MAG: tRNA pseudouridine(54/55) synthase Pus10 [Planctomycetes bacterium]|nr:tRNA pseudouridine(54/55) synthase Pus10 [Planctomycetota bacterium]
MTTLPELDPHIAQALERCFEAAESIEFRNFKVGVQGPKSWKTLPEHEVYEFKSGIKRNVGVALSVAWPERHVEFERPELLFVYDVPSGQVKTTIRPVFLYSRYQKLSRDLPQTPANWACDHCQRAGCEACGQSGLKYTRCLQDYLGELAQEAHLAEDIRLHGMGREDVDVRCLEGGRPFVLELRSPRRREVDLVALKEAIDAAYPDVATLAAPLRRVPRSTVARIKEFAADKHYRARVRAEAPLDPARVAALADLSGTIVEQRTPTRVSHRRSDKVRPRYIDQARPEPLEAEGLEFVIEIETESGTYIKELISGDGGRSDPSFSELLGVPCVCAELDVLAISASDQELLADDLRELEDL